MKPTGAIYSMFPICFIGQQIYTNHFLHLSGMLDSLSADFYGNNFLMKTISRKMIRNKMNTCILFKSCVEYLNLMK